VDDFYTFIESARTFTGEIEIIARLALAAVLGSVIGLDRELNAQPAGLRTHMLTALAAAVFTVLTFEIFQKVSQDGAVTADPIRIIEAVTAGVAFLAAGAIIQARGEVHGLTTGAGMWMAGAIGVACGGGFYTIAVFGSVLSLLILVLLGWVEDRLFGNKETRLSGRRKHKAD